jgi:A118 family predicted phage portal protein
MGIMSAIKEWWSRMFLSEVKDQFKVTGITSGDMQKAIQNWMLIYKGEPDWIDPEEGIKTIKFAKFVCGEIGRLATLAIDVTFDGARKEYMTQFWEKSVHDRIREWTELMCACGTVILKPNGTGVDLVTPDRFEITSIDGNHNITGIVFQDSYREGDEYFTKLEYHRFFTASVRMPDAEEYTETTYYSISNRAFVSKNAGEIGKPIDLNMTNWAALQPDVHITKRNGEQINSMLFGLFRMPSSNDIDLSSPLGLSAFADAIEELKDLDIAYSRNAEEIEESRRMVIVDDRLIAKPAYKDEKGNTVRPTVKMPKFFKALAGVGVRDEEVYHEVNPTLNTDTRKSGINQQLSLVGVKCGFSNGYFVIDEKTGMVTATQVESDDRRTIQLIKDVRDAMQNCLDDLFYAQSVFADLYNLAPAGDYEPQYDFGDITYNEEEDRMRNLTLANSGYIPKWQYLVRFEGYSEEEAKTAVEEASGAQDKGLFKEE